MELTTDEGNLVIVDAATIFTLETDNQQNSQDTDEFAFSPQAPGRLWGMTVLAASDDQSPVRIVYLRLSDAQDDAAQLTAKAKGVIAALQSDIRDGKPALDVRSLL